jgi:uncharacterized membrane protein YqaE (UPF0057 family)
MDILRIVLAIFLPPLAVFLTVGLGLQFWINIVLTILGVVPGMIHALWVIVKKKEQ